MENASTPWKDDEGTYTVLVAAFIIFPCSYQGDSGRGANLGKCSQVSRIC